MPTVPLRPAALAACVLAAAACEEPPPSPEAASWPEDTVLAIGTEPITAAEVDRWVPLVASIEPHRVRADHRRKALTNVVLPIAAARQLDPAAREEAFRLAEAARAHAAETGELPPDAPRAETVSGTWKQIGMVEWELAKDLEPGAWSPVHETVGAFGFLRVLEPPADGAWGPRAEATVERVTFFYLPTEDLRGLVDQALLGLPKEVVDPEWETLLPPYYTYEHR